MPSAISLKWHIQRKGHIQSKVYYLLPARQNINNFKHALHNIHLKYKHKVIVFKIPDYTDHSYHGNRYCQKWFYYVAKKY